MTSSSTARFTLKIFRPPRLLVSLTYAARRAPGIPQTLRRRMEEWTPPALGCREPGVEMDPRGPTAS